MLRVKTRSSARRWPPPGRLRPAAARFCSRVVSAAASWRVAVQLLSRGQEDVQGGAQVVVRAACSSRPLKRRRASSRRPARISSWISSSQVRTRPGPVSDLVESFLLGRVVADEVAQLVEGRFHPLAVVAVGVAEPDVVADGEGAQVAVGLGDQAERPLGPRHHVLGVDGPALGLALVGADLDEHAEEEELGQQRDADQQQALLEDAEVLVHPPRPPDRRPLRWSPEGGGPVACRQ